MSCFSAFSIFTVFFSPSPRCRFSWWFLCSSHNCWQSISFVTCKSCDNDKRNRISSHSPSSWYGRLQRSFSPSATHGTWLFHLLLLIFCNCWLTVNLKNHSNSNQWPDGRWSWYFCRHRGACFSSCQINLSEGKLSCSLLNLKHTQI